jgi:chromosome segregation ATPase
MLQANEIQQRFSTIQQSIQQASQACQSSSNVPSNLQDCIQQLDSQSSDAQQVMQSQDQQQIMQCIDQLEQLGDRARDACQQSQNVDGQLKQAVMQTHSQLSDLKRQMH